MKLSTLDRRLSSLEGGIECPRCRARRELGPISDEQADLLAADPVAFFEKYDVPELPDPSPSCPECHKHDGCSEEEIDAELRRLINIWRRCRAEEGEA